jgi:uncharacterized protein YwgA
MKPEELGELEIIEGYIILLLGILNRPIPSREHLQKELFILSRVNPRISKYITFEKHYEGPYSVDLAEIAENPLYYPEAFQVDKNGRLWLTSKGKEIYDEIVRRYSEDKGFKELLSVMKMIREVYERLSKEELLFLIYATCPEYRSALSDELLSPEKRRYLAEALLKKGIITRKRYEELISSDYGGS